jgi:hypothetical protein
MANTTFSGPVRSKNGFQSIVENATTGAITSTGYGVMTQSQEVTFAADGTETVIGTIPANSQIVEVYVDVSTAFDAATTNTISLGDGTTADQYAATLDVSSAGRLRATSDVSQIGNLVDIGASDVALTATYNQTGTAATAGVAQVTVLYVPNNNLA